MRSGSKTARVIAAVFITLLFGGLATTVAQATAPTSTAPGYSQYDDAIAEANRKKAEQDRRMEELQHELEDTDAAIVEANFKLMELNERLPGVQEEYRLAQERLDAALAQQKIVADQLAAAEAEDRELAAKMAEDEARSQELRDALAQIAIAQYQGSQVNSSLAIIFGATTSEQFVDDFSYREATARVQANALSEVEEIAAINRNREVRQGAVREYIVELKRQADALVVEAEAAKKVAEEKKAEVERLLAEAQELKRFLESKRAEAIAKQKQLEAQQQALLNELADLVAKKKAAEAANGNTGTLGKGYLSFPTKNPYITSSYGNRLHPVYNYWRLHAGTDFRAYCGTAIYAAAAGTVEWATAKGGFGNQVMLDHGIVGGKVLMTSYSHLSKFNVSKGQKVKRGDLIGYSGNTGTSTACHLHFEVYVDGSTVDPMTLLPSL